MRAKKTGLSDDLHTASEANHPQQGPDHRVSRGMSGRQGVWHKPEGHARPMGDGGSTAHPKILHQPPRGRRPVAAPNGGSYKPNAGRGKVDPVGGY